jgi:hypothetical protein
MIISLQEKNGASRYQPLYSAESHDHHLSHFLESSAAANAVSLFNAGRRRGFFPLVRAFFFTPCPAKDPRLPMIFMLLNNSHHG